MPGLSLVLGAVTIVVATLVLNLLLYTPLTLLRSLHLPQWFLAAGLLALFAWLMGD